MQRKKQKSNPPILPTKKSNRELPKMVPSIFDNFGHSNTKPLNTTPKNITDPITKSSKDLEYVNLIDCEDGWIYSGQMQNGKKVGVGILQDSKSNIYEGEFIDDKIEGYGIYKTSEGTTYKGQWKNGIQEEHGIETWPDGSFYKGEYLKGLKHGNGYYKWGDGSEYSGNWKEGNIDGYVF